MNNIVSRLLHLKKSGVDLEQALDIGAYRNEFTNILKSIWPNIKVQQFEADERQKKYLEKDAKIVVLGDSEKEVVLYTLEDTGYGSTTGTSIFKENTTFYKNPINKTCQMKTLDSVVDMSGDWSKGLIKIDTQGSELLILKGATEFLKNDPMYILLECSFVEYNQGAPLVSEVTSYMDSIGYRPIDIVDLHYHDNQLIQGDYLFQKYINR